MLVYINARFLSQPITGVQRYAIELLTALDNLIDVGKISKLKFSFTLIGPSQLQHDLNLKHIPLVQFGRLTGHLWEQFELPLYTRGKLLVNLCNTFPLFKFNQILVIHDASVFGYPQTYSFAFRLWYKFLLRLSGNIVRKIITVSSYSKAELMKYCNVNFNKLQAIYEGKEHITRLTPDYSVLTKHSLHNNQFVLAVSSNKLNKNFSSFARAIEHLSHINFNAVIAGTTNQTIYSSVPSFASGKVKHLGYISDQQLKALYEHASCFVYPSFYEGFGLPPLEAMACGCPVVVSNTTSLPEVCADAALYCDPFNPNDIADKIQQLLTNDYLKQELRSKGLARSKQFSWEKCASEVFEVVEQCCM